MMRKIILLMCLSVMLTGCTSKTPENSVSKSVIETTAEEMTESQTEMHTESETEEVTETNIYEKQTYREVLYNMYYNCEFPDWDYKNYGKDVSIDFAVYDIDSDGREELLVTFDNRAIYVYDHNADGNLVQQFSGYIKSDFYENGAVRVYSAHNQTHSFEVHPFTEYEYDKETDSYNKIGIVYGLDKDIVDMINQEKEEVGMTDFLDYPAEFDTSNSGTVYYIRPDWDRGAEIPIDVTEFNERYEQFTEGTEIIDIPFMKLTEENIKNVNV